MNLNEWQKVELGEVVDINPSSLSNSTSPDFEFKYIDLSSVETGRIDFPDCTMSFKDAPSRARRIFKKNDILMSTVRPNLQAFAHINFNPENYIASTGFAVLRASSKIDPNFLYQNLYSQDVTCQINGMLVGSNYPAINSSDVASIIIPLPPLSEQKRIAEGLGCWDEGTEKVSKAIALKEQQKRGLMQRLLTGKVRLPGFIQQWKEVKLRSLCRITTGKKDVNEGNPNGVYPFFTCAREHTFSDSYSHDKEAILIAGNGEVGNCQYYHGKFEAYQRTYILSNFTLNTFLLFENLNYFLKSYVENQKQQGAMPYIKLGTLTEFKLIIPSDIKEQSAIAAVLSEADNEISLLKQKLELFKRQKKWLMQQLLTGKKRLKIEEN